MLPGEGGAKATLDIRRIPLRLQRGVLRVEKRTSFAQRGRRLVVPLLGKERPAERVQRRNGAAVIMRGARERQRLAGARLGATEVAERRQRKRLEVQRATELVGIG